MEANRIRARRWVSPGLGAGDATRRSDGGDGKRRALEVLGEEGIEAGKPNRNVHEPRRANIRQSAVHHAGEIMLAAIVRGDSARAGRRILCGMLIAVVVTMQPIPISS